MNVMTACVHDAHVLAVVRRPRSRSERIGCFLRYGKGVHVGANSDERTGTSSLQDAYDTRMSNPGADFHSHGSQVRGHEFGGAEFSVRQFGVLVNLVSYLGDARYDTSNLVVECSLNSASVHARTDDYQGD